MLQHSPEPWEEVNQAIRDAKGQPVADWCVGDAPCEELGDFIEPVNRKRIISCVNACRGIETDRLTDLNGKPALLAKLEIELEETADKLSSCWIFLDHLARHGPRDIAEGARNMLIRQQAPGYKTKDKPNDRDNRSERNCDLPLHRGDPAEESGAGEPAPGKLC